MRFLAATFATFGLLSGCVVHEPVAVPLSPADVERVNGVARENHWLRVEYVEPLATKAGEHVDRPATIASVDAVEIGFHTRAGDIETIPTGMVKGLTVKERGAGAAAGAGIGLGAGALFVGGVALLASALSGGGFPDSGEQKPASDGSIAKFVAFFTVTPTVIGAVVGYFVGGRHTFDLDRGMARELR